VTSYQTQKFPGLLSATVGRPIAAVSSNISFGVEQIHKNITTATHPSVIEALTFSTIPCRCAFFLTNSGINSYTNFMQCIRDEKPNHYDWFARVAFASPGLLSFVSSVFRPFLAECLFSSHLPELDYFRRMIVLNWVRHMMEYPLASIRVLVKSDNKCRTLSNTFFDLALRRETAALFGLVEFNQLPSANLIALLRRFLIYPSQNCLYDLLIPTLIGDEDWDSNFLTEHRGSRSSAKNY
jgi:hypothetical protein